MTAELQHYEYEISKLEEINTRLRLRLNDSDCQIDIMRMNNNQPQTNHLRMKSSRSKSAVTALSILNNDMKSISEGSSSLQRAGLLLQAKVRSAEHNGFK